MFSRQRTDALRVCGRIAVLLFACLTTTAHAEAGRTATQLRAEGTLSPAGVLTEMVDGRLVSEDEKSAVIFTRFSTEEVIARLGQEQALFPASVSFAVRIRADDDDVNYRVNEGVARFTFTSDRNYAAGPSYSSSTVCSSSVDAAGSNLTCRSGGRIVYESTCSVENGTVQCSSRQR